MKVALVNTFDSGGGAARAAYRLHEGLKNCGVDSKMIVKQRSRSQDLTVRSALVSMSFWSRARRFVRRKRIAADFSRYMKSRPDGFDIFTDDRSQYGSAMANQFSGFDIINLHWTSGLIDYEGFFTNLPGRKPIVWTLHDLNSLTGGCHYNAGCERYVEQCGKCPQLGSDDINDLSYGIWLRKKRALAALESGQLHIVTPSRWLAGESRRSKLMARFNVSVIPNGVDIRSFVPIDKRVAREALGIPINKCIILFVADSLSNRRKGFDLLNETLQRLASVKELFLLSIGNDCPAAAESIPHAHLGRLDNDRFLSLAYSAADIFVIPSLQDNLPNTVLEAISCGTPVIGFDTGGIPDMVRPGVTGYLVPAGDTKALGEAILMALSDGAKLKEMSLQCRKIAVEEYSLQVQANRYKRLYEELISSMKDPQGVFH